VGGRERLTNLPNQSRGRILERDALALKRILESLREADEQIVGRRKPLEDSAREVEDLRLCGVRLVLEEEQQRFEELGRSGCLDEQEHQVRNQDAHRAARVAERRQDHREELLEAAERDRADLRQDALQDLAEAVDHREVLFDEKRLAENDKRGKVNRLGRNTLNMRQQALRALPVARRVGRLEKRHNIRRNEAAAQLVAHPRPPKHNGPH
jgi:hypothetical protein